MSRKSTVVAIFAGAALYACGSSGASSSSSYDLAADQVDQAAAALTSASPDAAFTALTTQSAAGAAAPGMGGAAGGGHRDGEQRGKGRGGRGHGPGQGGMNGQQLLLWYADLSALQACRDQRSSCVTGEDASTCEQAARECVKPVLEAAFVTFCSEALSLCSDANASATACERIQARCSKSDAGV